MSADAVKVAPTCPLCRHRGMSVSLTPGASLEGSTCLRCGGTLVPTTGSERLLHEELALDRAALVDLSESFGGRRFPCPHCSARMRALLLRGVDVDLCFHCGALWLEAGELERLSGNRHRGLTPAPQQAVPTTALARPDASVRIDARTKTRKAVGSIARVAGIVAGGAWVLGFAPPAFCVAGVTLIGAGFALRRRSVVDVFPRARRVLRSRKYMPALATDEDAEKLDDKTFVVVRPFGSTAFASSTFVDSVGRLIAPLDTGARSSVLRDASRHARRLGATVVVDHRLDKDARPARALPTVVGDAPFYLRLRAPPNSWWEFEAIGVRRDRLFTLRNAVPGRGNEGPRERLALCFCLETPQGARLRFHDDGVCTVVVGDDGEPLGAVTRDDAVGGRLRSFSLAGRATRIHLIAPPIGGFMAFVDDAGARCGAVFVDQGQLRAEVRSTASDDVRFACAVLAAHAALDAGRRIESR